MKRFMRFTATIALGAMLAMAAGCQLLGFGGGTDLGLLSYEAPPGFVLANGQPLPEGSTIVDVLFSAGIDMAGRAMMDKWNVKEVVQASDPVTGQLVTRVVTEYGTFVINTGQLDSTIRSMWVEEDGQDLVATFEDADGSTQTGLILLE